MPIQNAFDEQTRDHAQVLLAEITRLRDDRNAVIRECAAVAGAWNPDRNDPAKCQGIYGAILALIEGDE